MTRDDSLPDDVGALKAALIGARAAATQAQAEAAAAASRVSNAEALIAHMKLVIEKMRRELFGSRSERRHKILDQMELELEDLEASATEDEIAAEMAAQAARATTIQGHTRRRPVRKPFPAHLPRERVLVPGPPRAPAAVLRTSVGLAKTSPKRWRSFRASGR